MAVFMGAHNFGVCCLYRIACGAAISLVPETSRARPWGPCLMTGSAETFSPVTRSCKSLLCLSRMGTGFRSSRMIACGRSEDDCVARGLTLTLPLGSQVATQTWFRRGLALTLCIGVAAVAEIGGTYAPLVGAPLFAIAIGVLITNAVPVLAQQRSLWI